MCLFRFACYLTAVLVKNKAPQFVCWNEQTMWGRQFDNKLFRRHIIWAVKHAQESTLAIYQF
jgi:hypothetical protein